MLALLPFFCSLNKIEPHPGPPEGGDICLELAFPESEEGRF